MKTWKLRLGGLAAAAALATLSVVGAFAFQDDGSSAETVPPDDSPIVYRGGHGLFPVHE